MGEQHALIIPQCVRNTLMDEITTCTQLQNTSVIARNIKNYMNNSYKKRNRQFYKVKEQKKSKETFNRKEELL